MTGLLDPQLVQVKGVSTDSSGEGRLTGCVGGISGMVLWVGITKVFLVYLEHQGGV